MNWKRTIFLLAGWLTISVVAGLLIYLVLPKKYVSLSELAMETEVLSTESLAHFDKLNLADSVEVQIIMQLMKNPQVLEHAAKAVPGYKADDVKDNLKVLNDDGSAIITLKLAARKAGDARALMAALVEKALMIDGAKKESRSRGAIASIQKRIKEVEGELSGLNTKIQKHHSEKGIVLSSDSERQQTAAVALSQYEQKLATLKLDDASLQNRLKRIDELIATTAKEGAVLSGFEFEDLDKNYTLAEARKRLLDMQAELASLRARYGESHPQVQAAKAEVASTKKTLREILTTQRERLSAQIADGANAIKLTQEQLAATESQAKQTDLLLDPEYADMLTQRDALRASYTALSNRLSELTVYANAKSHTFYIFSEPTLPPRASLLQFLSIIALSLVAGGALGFVHLLYGVRAKPQPIKATIEPAYAHR